MHLVGYFYGCITMHGFVNVKFTNRYFRKGFFEDQKNMSENF